MSKATETIAWGASFMDPQYVGSTVRWNLTKKVKPACEVSISDCIRVITWYGFDLKGLESMRRKLRQAVIQFENCDAAIERYLKAHPRRGKKCSA